MILAILICFQHTNLSLRRFSMHLGIFLLLAFFHFSLRSYLQILRSDQSIHFHSVFVACGLSSFFVSYVSPRIQSWSFSLFSLSYLLFTLLDIVFPSYIRRRRFSIPLCLFFQFSFFLFSFSPFLEVASILGVECYLFAWRNR